MRRRGVHEPRPARRGRRGGAELRVARLQPARRSCSRPPAAMPDLVSIFAGAVPYPVATSFAVEVYRILPNDTDFSPFRDSGRFTGLNSAYIDGSATYHTPEDRPEYMDRRSLQHLGGNALGDGPRAGCGRPEHESRAWRRGCHLLPGARAAGHLSRLAGLAAGAARAAAVVRRGLLGDAPRTGRRRPAAPPASGWRSSRWWSAPVSAQLFWLLLKLLRPGYANMIDPWSPGWFRAAVVALVATVLLTWFALLRRRIGALALSIGALGWLAVLGAVLAAVTPGGSYLAALPALAGGLAVALSVMVRGGVVGVVGQACRRRGRGDRPGADGDALLPGAGSRGRWRSRVVRDHARDGPAAAAGRVVPRCATIGGRSRRTATRGRLAGSGSRSAGRGRV